MKPAIIDIQGIGPAAASALAENNVNSLKELAGASVDQIAAVPGFSAERAAKVIAAATDLLAASGTSIPDEEPKKGGKKAGKGKKDKKKKKKKGKDKKKGK
jgi:transcription termination factor NusA